MRELLLLIYLNHCSSLIIKKVGNFDKFSFITDSPMGQNKMIKGKDFQQQLRSITSDLDFMEYSLSSIPVSTD